MSDDKNYNGWTNYETWLFNLWNDGDTYIQEKVQEIYNDADSDRNFTKEERARLDVADWLKEYNDEMMEEISIPDNGFIRDLINAAIGEIDWYDLAESYLADVDKEESEEETETE